MAAARRIRALATLGAGFSRQIGLAHLLLIQPGVIDPAIAIGAALLTGAVLPFSPGPALLALGASAFLARGRLTWGLGFVLLLATGLGAWRAGRAVASFEAEREATIESLSAPVRCEARGVVIASPMLLRGSFRWYADLYDILCEEEPVPGRLRARLYDGPESLARGDHVEVVANLGIVQLFRNDGLSDPRPTAARSKILLSGGVVDAHITEPGRGPFAWIDRRRSAVRSRIFANFPSDTEAMARALVLGENDLDPDDGDAFRMSGLAHLLAVSGLHLALAVLSIVSAVEAILRRIERLAASVEVGRIAAAIGVLLAWIYADFAGGSGSVRRAATMVSAVLGARVIGRRPSGVRAFGLSAVALGAIEPLAPFDFSFALSLSATGGLLGFGPWLQNKLVAPAPRLLKKPMSAVAATISATIPCSPLLATLAPKLPAVGVFANVLAVPIGELVALPACLAHAVLGFWPSAERGAAVLASGALIVVRAIARTTASIPWLSMTVPSPTGFQTAILAILAAALALGWARDRKRRAPLFLCAMAALLITEVATVRAGSPRGKLRITSLDVGQGDATIVDFPDGRSMLIDGGGLVGSPIDTGEAVVLPVHRVRRKKRVDVAVLSHPHPDHFLGLVSALAQLEVGEFWDTGQGEAEGTWPQYHEMLSSLRERNVPIIGPDTLCGGVRHFGGAKLEVFAPCPEPLPLINANDNSFVFRISLGKFAALLTGDAEKDLEDRLVRERGDSLRADFLKVGHHGSRTSSNPAFLAAVGARDALISCGIRNRFGHPHAQAMSSLKEAGLRIFRTDRTGSLVWETDGETVKLRSFATQR